MPRYNPHWNPEEDDTEVKVIDFVGRVNAKSGHRLVVAGLLTHLPPFTELVSSVGDTAVKKYLAVWKICPLCFKPCQRATIRKDIWTFEHRGHADCELSEVAILLLMRFKELDQVLGMLHRCPVCDDTHLYKYTDSQPASNLQNCRFRRCPDGSIEYFFMHRNGTYCVVNRRDLIKDGGLKSDDRLLR